RNIHQVLQLSVAEALHFFAGHEKILRPLRLLDEIGLGYLRLGQSATTLSGGEAQRLKLASHLATPRAAAGTLFLLDEPTTGLHFDDIAKLLAALQRLLAAGGSGGCLVAEGPPETVAASSASHLAPFLRAALKL